MRTVPLAAVVAAVAALSLPASAAPTSSTFVGVYVVSASGQDVVRITGPELPELDDLAYYAPSWSPDGNQLVFGTELCETCGTTIRVVTVRSSGRKPAGRVIGNGFNPSWSPTGGRIAFVAYGGRIATMARDGSRTRLVVGGATANDEPSWSPDGTKIVFTRQVSAASWELYSIGVDGTGLKRLSRNGQDLDPAWSPDGRKIAFTRQERSGLWQIYTINADGSGTRRLGNGRSSDTSPTWSPDSHRIAFARQRGRRSAIYVMNADGSAMRRVTAPGVDATQPAWSPRTDRLAFVRA